MTRTALQARCAIAVPSSTMPIHSYAGSGIKRGSCKSLSAICARYSRRPVLQFIHRVVQIYNVYIL